MGQRVVRVNELVKRELSALLHTRFREDCVTLTLTAVEVSPDLRTGRVFWTASGAEEARFLAERFFRQHGAELRRLLGQRIVLKYLPQIEWVEDEGARRGAEVNRLLDEIGLVGDAPPPTPPEPVS